jgi:hypothetical protein
LSIRRNIDFTIVVADGHRIRMSFFRQLS